MTVMRLSARCPRTKGSKRTWFCASVLATYTFPVVGRTAMLKSTVPTPVTKLVPETSASGVASAFRRKTSLSGTAKATDALQSRPISSRHLEPSNLTMRPVSGAPPVDPDGGGGSPPLLVTTCSVIAAGQRAADARARDVGRVDLDEAHAVGQVVHHPRLGAPGEVRPRRHGDRLEADRDLGGECQPAGGDRVDGEAIVGRVDGEEPI